MRNDFLGGFDAPAFKLQDQTTPTTTTPTATTPAQTRGRGGTLTSLISEGGALGGGAAGAAIGTAFLPVVGTAIGGVIGAGVGAFGGRLLENKVRDDRLGVTDAAKEGAISAVLAGPLKIGKYGATAAKGLKAGTALTPALTKAAEEATAFTLRGAAARGAEKLTENAIAKQFRLNPTQQFNFVKRHAEDAVDVIRRFNITDAGDVINKIRPLQQAFDDVVAQIPDIPKTTLKSSLENVYKPLIDSPLLYKKNLGQQLKAQADEILKQSGKSVPATLVNQLKTEFDTITNWTLKGAPEYGVARQSADGLRKLLQTEADKAGLNYGGATFKSVGKDLSKLRDINEIVGKQEYLGTGSLPFNLTNLLGAGAGSAVAGIPGAVGGALISGAVNAPITRRAMRLGAEKGISALETSAAKAVSRPITQAVLGAGRAGLVGGAGRAVLGGGVQQPATLEQALTTTPPTTQGFAPSTVTGGITPAPVKQSPYSRENLLYDIQRDPKNADNYVKYYQELQKVFAAPTTTQKPLSEAQQARQDIASLTAQARQMLATGDIKTGFISGRLEQAKGTLGIADPATLEFNTLISNLLGTIAKARGGTALSNQERAMLERYAPKVGDSKQQIETKLKLLERQFGQPTNVTSLEDMLIQQSQLGGTR